jgi:hypothetical protein
MPGRPISTDLDTLDIVGLDAGTQFQSRPDRRLAG